MRGQTFQVSAPWANKIKPIIKKKRTSQTVVLGLIMTVVIGARWLVSPDNSDLLRCHHLTLLTFHPANKTADEQDLQHHPGAGKRLHHPSAYSTHEDPAVDLSLMNTASVLFVPNLNSKSNCLSRAAVLLETPDHPRIGGSAGDLNVSCLQAPFVVIRMIPCCYERHIASALRVHVNNRRG